MARLREIISELQGNLLAAAAVLKIDLVTSSLEKLEILDQRTSSLASDSAVIRASAEHNVQQASEILQCQQEQKYQKACKWLSAPSPFIDYNRAIREHHPGTGLWFLDCNEQFASWKTSFKSAYWIHGKPGCGKTVLSAVIIRHLKESVVAIENTTLAYFFFNFNDKAKTKVDKLVRSLVLQLAVQTPNGQSELVNLYTSHSDLEELDYATLLAFLRRLISSTSVYLVIDALDECEEGREITDLIQAILGWNLDLLRVIFTSRNEEHLRAALEPLVSWEIDLENEYLNADLRNYIRETVTSDEELGAWSDHVQEEIVEALIEGANGM